MKWLLLSPPSSPSLREENSSRKNKKAGLGGFKWRPSMASSCYSPGPLRREWGVGAFRGKEIKLMIIFYLFQQRIQRSRVFEPKE